MTASEQRRPRFSKQDAINLAQELYGITASARELPSERDQNFHLKDDPDGEFVLKIANVAEKKEVLDFQNKVLEHLAERDNAVAWPRVCATKRGERIATVKDPDGSTHLVRMLTYVPGVPLADARPHTPELLRSLGRFLGQMDKSLQEFSPLVPPRDLKWDMKNASRVINNYIEHIANPERRAIVEHFLQEFEQHVVPVLPALRASVIHNDANEYNVLVSDQRVVGIIDFGDMVDGYPVCDLAIAVAYTMLGKTSPLAAATHVVGGYHEVFPLTERELAVLFYLICMRLCLSVIISAHQQKLEPDNHYLKVSEQPAWAALEKLITVSPQLAHYIFRDACHLLPCPQSAAVVQWLKDHQDKLGPVVAVDLKTAPKVIFDLSVGSLEIGNPDELSDTKALTDVLFGRMKAANAEVGIGRYNEARLLYTGDVFKSESDEIQEQRTIHSGIDLFMEPGSPVFAPLDGVVHSFRNNAAPLDYGPTIILQHEVDNGRLEFLTLYGHLSEDSLEGPYEGKPVKKGDQIAQIGNYPTNGGWPPHLHFQIITDMLGQRGDFPGVALPSQRAVWLSISPDPNLMLGIPEGCFPDGKMTPEDIFTLRQQLTGKNLSISYKKPLNIVRGFRQYLYDECGQAYLDAVNNVAHVGHCHPRVVKAAQQQMAVLNTNTRYLHENLVKYAQRLCATLPEPLSVCFFVCSGSEANELALRLARAHTEHTDVIVVDGAYHGNTTSLIEISPYKFDGTGGSGAPPHVHKVIMPDVYRGPYKANDPQAGGKYARHVQQTIEKLQQQNRHVAAFFCEPLLGCAGQIVLPSNYLKEAYRYVRAADGVCVADEVQIGFGRVGTHFWGFETQDVVPDIVTLGKPIGNGHPLAAVVTTLEIAASFANGMEYFNSFGGNPVSCAVGLAVLDVIEDERLQENALNVGAHMLAGLEGLMKKHRLIGDVRGMGLFIGVELVLDRETLAPAADQAAYIVERMKEHGILLSTDGPLHNVLKIKPPMVFSEADADFLVGTLDKILAEDFVRI
jgi:4-aminobutyrate aminotransferase-like enzyme/Ser/Thr protein kinase RdoA (MazF antagonist)